MAAVRASQPDQSDWFARHVDRDSGQPLPIAGDEDYFSAFGVKPGFFHDQALLQARYYELSRALHPDRFATSGPEILKRSMERMSFVNDAYQTLKDPVALREYVLERAGKGATASGSTRSAMPAELAEAWFEIQDLKAEEPELTAALVKDFVARLKVHQDRVEKEIASLERLADSSGMNGETLEALRLKMHERQYLNSLARDVTRIASPLTGGSRGDSV